MLLRTAGALAALLIAGACGDEPPTPPTPPPPPDVTAILARHQVEWSETQRDAALAAGREAIARHECNRCHTIDDIQPAGRSDHCTSCHIWLKGLEPDHRHYRLLSSRYGEETVQRYQRNIFHYQEVPDLSSIAKRLRPAWIDTFLQSPWDLRPAMDETMVRTRLPEADRRAIVRYFAAVSSVADPYEADDHHDHGQQPSAARINQGKQLFLTRGCTACHTFGNLDTGKTVENLEAAGVPAKLAPNLRFVRDRMNRDLMVAWIEDPLQLKPGTLMPDLQLSHEDAEKVADFLIWGDPELRPTPSIPDLTPPAPLDRPVGWAEVKERVLGRICVHCHMNDHERDRGPGNEGGFGWPGSRLAMRTYETLVHGALDLESGERYSVLQARPGHELPPLIEAMLERRVEERRDRVAAFADHDRPAHRSDAPAMPMGLPHIPDDEIALVRAWIAQGCKGPTEVTGMPGIDDGFLVPDGPIADNEGCDLREPGESRPAWSTQPPPEWERQAQVQVRGSGSTSMSASMASMQPSRSEASMMNTTAESMTAGMR